MLRPHAVGAFKQVGLFDVSVCGVHTHIIRIWVYISVYLNIIYTYLIIDLLVCLFIHSFIQLVIYLHTCLYLCIYRCIHIYIYKYVFIHLFFFMYLFICLLNYLLNYRYRPAAVVSRLRFNSLPAFCNMHLVRQANMDLLYTHANDLIFWLRARFYECWLRLAMIAWVTLKVSSTDLSRRKVASTKRYPWLMSWVVMGLVA